MTPLRAGLVALLLLAGLTAGCAPNAADIARALAPSAQPGVLGGGEVGAFCVVVVTIYGTVRVARSPGLANVTCTSDGMIVTPVPPPGGPLR